jgi:heme/copper-type cytochrome/quinol oxidase subunit 2
LIKGSIVKQSACLLFIASISLATDARAEDLATYSVTLKNHRFTPTEIHVPSGKPFFILVTNADDTADEFEMNAPPVEKVIAPGQEGRLRIRPLAPGRFKFFDDFHQDTAQGAFISE